MSGTEEKKQLGKIALRRRPAMPGELEEAGGTRGTGVQAEARASAGGSDEVDALTALSDRHGVPGLDLGQVVIPLENLRLVPAEIARQHLILPILVKDDRILLAMADPSDRRTIDEIEFVTGRSVYPYVAFRETLEGVIATAYRKREAGEEYYVGPNVTEEHLASLGIRGVAAPQRAPSAPRIPPPPPLARPVAPPPPPVADETAMPSVHPAALSRPAPAAATEDELGIAELVAQKGGSRGAGGGSLDDAFNSRVGPLPKEGPKPRPDQPKVLVVDDEDDIRRLLARVLTQKGYHVIEASKGLEALQAVRDHVPDVILLDAMLPEVHGFDICRRIKGSQRYGHIPIIMVSAIYRGWRVAMDLKTSYGVEAFLEKPFKVSDVIAHVENALAGRSSVVNLDATPSQEIQTFIEGAMQAYRGGDVDGAIAKLQEGLAVDPLAFPLHYHLGLLYGRRDQVFDAIHELERAVDLAPKHFAALKNLAVLYQRVGFKHKAIELWERALASAPDDETRQGIKDHLMNLL